MQHQVHSITSILHLLSTVLVILIACLSVQGHANADGHEEHHQVEVGDAPKQKRVCQAQARDPWHTPGILLLLLLIYLIISNLI